jgi:hypothetical protein
MFNRFAKVISLDILLICELYNTTFSMIETNKK